MRDEPLDRSQNHAEKLGPLGAYSIGIGGIVGGGIFATLGLAANGARGSTMLSFLVGGVVALLTAYSYVQLTLAFPSRGGTVTFIDRAYGKGLLASSLNTLLLIAYVVVLAVYANAFGTYGSTFFPEPDRAFWQKALMSGSILLMAFLNLVGPGLVDRSEGFFNVSKLGILVLFVGAGLLSPSFTAERLGPADWVPVASIIANGMLVFLSYEGFELIANASERIQNPTRTLPFAYYGSVITAIVLYFGIIVVTLGHLDFARLEHVQQYALSAAAEVSMGRFGFILLGIGALLATASALNAGLFGASKIPVILAEDGEMPLRYDREIWGRKPLGLAMLTLWCLVVAHTANLNALSGAASGAFLLVFTLVNLANVKLAVQTNSRAWISGLAALASLAALFTMLGQMLSVPGQRHDVPFIVGMLALSVVYQLVYRVVRRFL